MDSFNLHKHPIRYLLLPYLTNYSEILTVFLMWQSLLKAGSLSNEISGGKVCSLSTTVKSPREDLM